MPWTRAVNDEWLDLWCVFMSAFFGETIERYRKNIDAAVVTMIERGMAMNATAYKRVELLRTSIWRDMARLFESYDALLCPTCAITAPPVHETDDDYVSTLTDGRFKGLDMTCPFNMLPQLPALSLPVGLQIVGRRFGDEHVLSHGAALEARLIATGITQRVCRHPEPCPLTYARDRPTSLGTNEGEDDDGNRQKHDRPDRGGPLLGNGGGMVEPDRQVQAAAQIQPRPPHLYKRQGLREFRP
ncbi:amidase [Rhizobium sp. NZLR1b]|uniref:amidase n=1 Tax=Rhizobium sp. NZLR1b TaxID=2731099 RepID=UPI0021809E33|nr:amidase [Rhizobium sp. NZLR1b]